MFLKIRRAQMFRRWNSQERRLPIAALVIARWLCTPAAYAGSLDFPPSDFKIMDSGSARVIGHGHYEITRDGNGRATAFGEDRFDNGEYDIERDNLQFGDDQDSRMLTFEHTFFNADGTLQRVNKADFQTGQASCTKYENGQSVIRELVLQVPPDTFAGSAIVVPMRAYLTRGERDRITLHDFNCIPGPEILSVRAYLQPLSNWSHFPSQVVAVDIKPDFGWLNLLVDPFLPEIRAWFDPADDWRFVGARFSRYYKGPEIILALRKKQEMQAH